MNRPPRFIIPTLLIAVFLIATIPTARAQQLATLYVDPPSIEVPVCTEFNIAISVADVVNLYSFQVWMNFDPTRLECTGASEGPFLKSLGGSTIWIPPIIDNDTGTIFVGCTLTAPPGVSGSGKLANVAFHCKGVGYSDLTFIVEPNTFLVDPNHNPMPFEAIDGSVTQYARPVGGVLVPVNKFDILAPYLALVGLVGAVTVALAAKRRHKP